jgi:arsenite methyltransferase
VAQLAFDEATGKQLEALYRIGDAVRRRRLVRAALGAAPGERILDVGCGPGFYCAELLEEVGSNGGVVGVDGSPQMLNLAAHRCGGAANVEFHEADATALPVKDASVDGVVCVQVLEYVANISAALGEFYRALRPGGRVVVWDTDWATLSWHSADPARMQRMLGAWDEHLVHPSLPQTLGRALRSAGFEDVRTTGHAFATTNFDPDTFATALIPMIERFIAGRNGISEDEAKTWASEQHELGERGEFFSACTQFCFTATRPG